MILWLAVAVPLQAVIAQEAGTTDPPVNLEVLRSLATRIALQAGTHGLLQSVPKQASVIVFPQQHAWYIEGAVVDGLKSLGYEFPGSGTAVNFQFGIAEAGTSYSNLERESLFGKKVVDRTIHLKLDVKLMLMSGAGTEAERSVLVSYMERATDRVPMGVISRLENKLLPITQGTLPEEGFFSTIAEPLIVIGSIAVAVILLFNVRS